MWFFFCHFSHTKIWCSSMKQKQQTYWRRGQTEWRQFTDSAFLTAFSATYEADLQWQESFFV